MPEVQNIFSEYGGAYESSHLMSFQQRKTFHAIQQCRTAALGGHVDECPDCGYQRPSYNSCRNRHCPKCQQVLKERWIENQSFDLLNIQYFHVVFTVPADLDVLYIKQLMGHSCFSSTDRYLHVAKTSVYRTKSPADDINL